MKTPRRTAMVTGADVLCNLAGGFCMADPVHETQDSVWDFLPDIHARTPRNMIHAVVLQC